MFQNGVVAFWRPCIQSNSKYTMYLKMITSLSDSTGNQINHAPFDFMYAIPWGGGYGALPLEGWCWDVPQS